jgi:hypothetical protein
MSNINWKVVAERIVKLMYDPIDVCTKPIRKVTRYYTTNSVEMKVELTKTQLAMFADDLINWGVDFRVERRNIIFDVHEFTKSAENQFGGNSCTWISLIN